MSQFIQIPQGSADHVTVTATATLTAAGRERERILHDLADVRHMQPRQIVVSDFSPDHPRRLTVFMPTNDGSYHTTDGIVLPRAQLDRLLDRLSMAAPSDSRKVARLPQGLPARYTVELVGDGTDRVLLISGGTPNLSGLPLTLFWRGSIYTLTSPGSAFALLDVLALLAPPSYTSSGNHSPLRPFEDAPFLLPYDDRAAFNWGSFSTPGSTLTGRHSRL